MSLSLPCRVYRIPVFLRDRVYRGPSMSDFAFTLLTVAILKQPGEKPKKIKIIIIKNVVKDLLFSLMLLVALRILCV